MFSKAKIDISLYKYDIKNTAQQKGIDVPISSPTIGDPVASIFEVKVEIPIFAIAFISFLGWIFFIFYGGFGLAFLPFDLIVQYFTKPKLLTKDELEKEKIKLQGKIKILLQNAEELKSKKEDAMKRAGLGPGRFRVSKVDIDIINFENQVISMEEDYDNLVARSKYSSLVDPVKYLISLLLGFIFVIVSILWVIQLIFHLLLEQEGVASKQFIDGLLKALENSIFSFLSIILLTGFGAYLMFCTLIGNLKLGFRIAGIIQLYAMKPNYTYMNALFANILLFNLWACAVIHCSTMVFSDFMVSTSAEMIFLIQINNLTPFRVLFYKYWVIYVQMLAFVFAIGYAIYNQNKLSKPQKASDKYQKVKLAPD